MRGAHDAEVGAVQGGDACRSEAFGDRDEAGVGSAERQVLVAVDELSDTLPVNASERLDREGSVDDRVVERWFGVWSELAGEQVDGFGNDHRSGHQWPGCCFEELEAGVVAAVVAIGGSDEWAGVYDQHWSVATEPVGEEFVDLMADPVFARSDSREAELTAARRSTDVGSVIGEDFGGEFLDCDPTRGSGCFQATGDVVRNVHSHRHFSSLMRSAGVVLAFEAAALGSGIHKLRGYECVVQRIGSVVSPRRMNGWLMATSPTRCTVSKRSTIHRNASSPSWRASAAPMQ